MKINHINDYSIYGDVFKPAGQAWIIEKTFYRTRGDEVSVESAVWQAINIQPRLFTSKKEAEEAVPEMLKEGTTLQLIGYSIKEINLVQIKDSKKINHDRK